MTSLRADLSNLHQPDALVELYTLDCTALGGDIYRFTPMFEEAGTLSLNGDQYATIPIVTSGWDYSSTGEQPRPTLQVSNVNKTLLAAVVCLGDLVGAKVTRIRIYAKNLDGQPDADPSDILGPDVYHIERKVSHTAVAITWELASDLERFGRKFGRQILKDGSEDPTKAALNSDGSFRFVYAPGIRRAY